MRRVQHGGYVQFGCGLTAPASWINFDASPTLRLQRIPLVGRPLTRHRVRFPPNVLYGDITRGLPIEPASCQVVYCSHVLEHLALEDCRSALRNTFTLLRPGGVFRLVVPDMEFAAQSYLNSRAEQPSVELVRSLHMGREVRPRGLIEFLTVWLGNKAHLWMWDFKSLRVELERVGFTDIRRAVFGDNPDPRFREVEDRGRWEECLGVECRRPPA